MRKRGSGLIGEVRKRPEFMGYAVSIPQYLRLESLQKATIDMDRHMKQLAMRNTPAQLNRDPSWRELVLIMRSLIKLLPDDVKNENLDVVWWY